jgi:hypothetical protein
MTIYYRKSGHVALACSRIVASSRDRLWDAWWSGSLVASRRPCMNEALGCVLLYVVCIISWGHSRLTTRLSLMDITSNLISISKAQTCFSWWNSRAALWTMENHAQPLSVYMHVYIFAWWYTQTPHINDLYFNSHLDVWRVQIFSNSVY